MTARLGCHPVAAIVGMLALAVALRALARVLSD